MRKKFVSLLLSAVLLLEFLPVPAAAAADISVDEEHFPDPVFLEYVRKWDKDANGTLSPDEACSVSAQ